MVSIHWTVVLICLSSNRINRVSISYVAENHYIVISFMDLQYHSYNKKSDPAKSVSGRILGISYPIRYPAENQYPSNPTNYLYMYCCDLG